MEESHEESSDKLVKEFLEKIPEKVLKEFRKKYVEKLLEVFWYLVEIVRKISEGILRWLSETIHGRIPENNTW